MISKEEYDDLLEKAVQYRNENIPASVFVKKASDKLLLVFEGVLQPDPTGLPNARGEIRFKVPMGRLRYPNGRTIDKSLKKVIEYFENREE